METVWLNHSATTRQTRTSCYRVHVEPHLAHLDLADVTAPVVEQWLADLKRSGVSQHMLRHAYDLVRTITKHWYEQAGVPNPVAAVKRPANPPASTQHRAKDCAITAAQYQFVIAACKTTSEELMIRVATEAGLRIGEIAGLQRRDIGLVAKTITIKRQGNRNTTKTGQVRVITMLGDELHDAFAQHLTDMDERGWTEPDDYIWRGGNPHHTDRPNQPYERQGVHRIIKRVLARVDLDKVTRPHGLRATGAQLLIEAGASMELVSQHLGHATIRTTEEYYVGTVKTSGLTQFDQAFG
jgi:integrase